MVTCRLSRAAYGFRFAVLKSYCFLIEPTFRRPDAPRVGWHGAPRLAASFLGSPSKLRPATPTLDLHRNYMSRPAGVSLQGGPLRARTPRGRAPKRPILQMPSRNPP